MKSSVLISSTESIEGMKIERYFDLISTNVVLGTNLFSDFGASLSDLFGGSSDIYQNKLERIYKIGIDKLKYKAQQLGANGIVGIRIDFDEVSGGGKSMFMLSVIGMAVRLIKIQDDKTSIHDSSGAFVLLDDLNSQMKKMHIVGKVKNLEPPTQDDWEFLMESPIEEILPDLVKIYLHHFRDSHSAIHDTQKILRNYFSNYLRSISEDLSSSVLYSKISENSIVVSTLISESRSFSPEKTLELLNRKDIMNAVLTLQSDKRVFRKEDLINMISIVDRFENLPDTGRVETVKTLLGGNKEKFVCESKHQNGLDSEFCSNEGCGKNIKGLRRGDLKIIDSFKLKVEALKLLLNK